MTTRVQYLMESGHNEWYTPPYVLHAVRTVLGGTISFDPFSCAAANEYVQAEKYYTQEDDALVQDWPFIGTLFANPPYERKLIDACINRCVEHYREYPGMSQCILVNVASETKWFQQLLSHSNAICFFRKRISFISNTGEPTKGNTRSQAMFYFGDVPWYFEEVFFSLGTVIQTKGK